VISSHASILTAFPETGIFRLGEAGISEVQATATEPDRLTKSFLDGPPAFQRHLLPDAGKN
jgi:predicted ATPase